MANCGRYKIMTLAEEDAMLEYLIAKPTAYLDEVAWQIFEFSGKVVSLNTVSRALHRRGWSRKVAKKEAAQRSYVAKSLM
jgi:transposase